MALAASAPPDAGSVDLKAVKAAAKNLQGAVLRTPAVESPKLSALAGAQIFIKYEAMQATGSFKDRGALNKLLSLDEQARRRGVIAISAGNHAQAVAYHASRLGIPATIVMPETAPFNKVENTEAYGAKVILSGETVSESRTLAEHLIVLHGFTLVHPYDDPLVIAGQGTAALEFLEDCPSLDCLIVPIGGGGLIAGVATTVKALQPKIEVFGAELEAYPSVYAALRGVPAHCGGTTLAEGIAVKEAGQYTVPIIRELVSDIILVKEPAVEEAVFLLSTLQKTVAEGASAAALAALLGNKQRFAGRRVGLIHCGANIDPRVLASITMRGLERECKIVSLRISISDRPGTLGEIASALGRCGANILEVYHRRFYLDVPAKGAVVEIVIETKNKAHADQTVEQLRLHGFQVDRINNLFGDLSEPASA
ncbi:MAG TPA: threonine ammonia-lyase [Hyphomicrobiales bacterium]|nr:threonine ammonia-lyase [Hyphomicrobiales bacterium]